MKSRYIKMTLTFALVFIMITSLFSFSAFAATDDPYMTTADGVYTATVTIGDFDFVTFKAVPAYDAGGYWAPSSFDTPADALDVNWNISTSGYFVDSEYYEAYGSGYAACIDIMVGYYFDENDDLVIDDPDVGPVVVTAANPETDASIDFNIVANESPAAYTVAKDVIFQVVDPSTSLINDGSGDVRLTRMSTYIFQRKALTQIESLACLLQQKKL